MFSLKDIRIDNSLYFVGFLSLLLGIQSTSSLRVFNESKRWGNKNENIISTDFTITEIDPHEHPSFVSIRMEDFSSNIFVCGATCIGKQHIVTAASCMCGSNGTDMTITAADHNIFQEEQSDQKLTIYKIYMHPDFKCNVPRTEDFKSNDIAVIHTYEKIKFKHGIVVPADLDHPDWIEPEVTAVGYSALVNFDHHAQIPSDIQEKVLPHEKCVAAYSGTHIKITDCMFCTNATNGIVGCVSDRGGPLYVQDDESSKIYMYGMALRQTCSWENLPRVYIKTKNHLDWIRNIISGHYEIPENCESSKSEEVSIKLKFKLFAKHFSGKNHPKVYLGEKEENS